MKKIWLVILIAGLSACSTTRYVNPANGMQGATYEVAEGEQVKMGRLEPGAQQRTNNLIDLMNQAEETKLLHNKAMEAIDQDMVLSPAPATVKGAYPVVLINRNSHKERTIVYWASGFGHGEVEEELTPDSHRVIYLRGGKYYFKVLDENGDIQIMKRQIEIEPGTGEPLSFRPGPVNEFDVPKEYTYRGITYWGKVNID